MRVQLLLIAVVASIACRDATKPNTTANYSLMAYTMPDGSPIQPDSIQCEVFAAWSSSEPIVAPWSGTVIVIASRTKQGDRLFTSTSRTGTAKLTLAAGPGDSVRVTLAGDVNISFDGRMPSGSSDATGEWTCGAEAFGSQSPGEARGVWQLGREYLID